MIIKRLLIIGALTGGLLASAAGVAGAATSHLASPAAPAAATTHYLTASGNSPTAGSSSPAGPESTGEATSHESDGPGGHQDSVGQNTDHQFNGTE